MLELARDLLPLLRAGEPVAVATAVDLVGSSPYGLGSSMAVTADGRVFGSVAGGCVETSALEACRRLLAGGTPGVERFGFGQAAGEAAGLSCGGELDVLLHMPSGACVEAALTAAAAGRDAVLAVVTTGPRELIGTVLSDGPGLDRPAIGALPLELIQAAVRDLPGTGSVEVQCDPPLRLFVEVSRPAPLFAVTGATAIARPLAAGARLLGYRVVVCDHRPGFAAPGRVPDADEVVRDLPHRWLRGLPLDERSVVVLLTHDAELDPLALAEALEREVAYVGALGSRATAASRERQLAALGVDAASRATLHSPIGLDLGGGAPAEIAVSILAEVIASRTGRSGEPLRGREGPVRAALG